MWGAVYPCTVPENIMRTDTNLLEAEYCGDSTIDIVNSMNGVCNKVSMLCITSCRPDITGVSRVLDCVSTQYVDMRRVHTYTYWII
jgi:hypothetical protein